MSYGTLTAEGSTEWVYFHEGKGSMFVSGTFGGGLVTVEIKGRDGVARTLPGYEFSTNSSQTIEIGSTREVRLTLTGGAGHNIYWELDPLYVFNPSSGARLNTGS